MCCSVPLADRQDRFEVQRKRIGRAPFRLMYSAFSIQHTRTHTHTHMLSVTHRHTHKFSSLTDTPDFSIRTIVVVALCEHKHRKASGRFSRIARAELGGGGSLGLDGLSSAGQSQKRTTTNGIHFCCARREKFVQSRA